MTRTVARAALVAALVGAGRGAVADEASTLRNGSFAEWKDGAPVGWAIGTGATSGEGPSSIVEPGKEGGLSLSGSATTRVWRMVSQTVDATPNLSYRLTFDARASGLVREAGQFSSAYVGIVPRTNVGLSLSDAALVQGFRPAWTPCSLVIRAVPRQFDVVAFLSKTGRLEVRSAVWTPITHENAFDVLVDHVDRTYPYFAERRRLAEKGVDWRAHAATFRERATATRSPDRVVEVLTAMLAALEDPHVVIRRPGRPPLVPWGGSVDYGFDARAVAARLTDVRTTRGRFLTGRLAPDIGYAAIASLPVARTDADPLVAAVEAQYAAKGLVLDLRPCEGGDETVGLRIASALADRPRVYARRRFRDGPKHDDFGPWTDSTVSPGGSARFTGPVVVILGPGCISSGEGFAQALEVLPSVTTVGRPTRGASAYPAPIPLPDGIDVWVSRWQSARADGTLTEGKGIPPQVRVDATSPGDPALDKALEILREKLAGTSSPR